MCTPLSLTLSIVHSTISVLLFMSVIYVMIQFLLTRKEEETNRFGKICAIFFIMASGLSLLFHALMASDECYPWEGTKYHTAIRWVYLSGYAMFYVIQSFILLVIFFHRIYNVFLKTRFRLSPCVKNTYIGLFILELLFGLLTLFAILFSPPPVMLVTAVLFFILLIVLMISLLSLYLYKLIEVYTQLEDESDAFLVSAITKTFILVSLSVFITILRLISLSIRMTSFDTPYYIFLKWFDDFIQMGDTYTNFICVVVSYKAFKAYYGIMCRCMDSRCRHCWTDIVHHKSERMLSLTIQKGSNNNQTQVTDKNAVPSNSPVVVSVPSSTPPTAEESRCNK